MVDLGSFDFSSEGPGYYQLVAWPIATNPTLSDPTTCSDYSYYADSVGDISAANAFTMGSVFYTGGDMAVGVYKTFDTNPMPYLGTTNATFTLDSGGARISGVGFTDTFPSDLYLTGKVVQDTCQLQSQSITQAQINAITSTDIKSNVEPGPWLMLKDTDTDGLLDTVKVQGGVSYNIQTGGGEEIGTTVSLGQTCEIQVEVKHKDTITGTSVCPTTTTPTSQTNDGNNVSYESLAVVLAYDSSTDDEFGECLSITMQSDLSPTGAAASVLPGTTVPFSSVVTSTGPSPIDNSPVVITAPPGTTLTNVTTSSTTATCSLNGTNTVANCTTGWMNPTNTVTFDYSIIVPSTVTSGSPLTGSVQTVYPYDTNNTNNSQAITLNPATINSTTSGFSVSSDTITADGTASGTITATLTDSLGAPLSGMSGHLTASLVTGDTKTTISGFTEVSTTPGTYTASVSSTTIGDKPIVVTANSAPLPTSGNTTAHFVAGPLYRANSTFTVSPVANPADTTNQINWTTANGTDSYTGTLTARDAQSNPISTLTLSDIKFRSTSSDVTVSAVTNQGNGVYTVAYTSVVADSAPRTTLTVGTTPIGTTAGLPIPFKAGPAVVGPVGCTDPSKKGTNLSVSASEVSVQGTSTGTALITDANCNPVPNATVNFWIETGTSGVLTIVSDTTDANGIATATVTDNAADEVWLHAGITAGDIANSPQSIDFLLGEPDPDRSSLTLTSPKPVGQTMSATATIKDGAGNALSGKEVTVTLTGDATVGALSSPKIQTGSCFTDFTGMCSVAFTDPTAETVEVSAQVMVGAATLATVSGSPLEGTFTAGPPASTCANPNDPTPQMSTLTVTPDQVPVGESADVFVYVTDQYCNPIDGKDVTFGVNLSAGLGGNTSTKTSTGTITGGVATTSVTDNIHELVTVTAQVETLSLSAPVDFLAGMVNPGLSSFSITPDDPVPADGVSAYTAVFTARDSLNNTIDGLNLDDIVFGSSSGSVTVSSVTATGSGTYTVTYTSTEASDSYMATLFYKKSQIRGDYPIPFVAGHVSDNSAFTISPSPQTAGVGVTVSITALDPFGNPVNDLTQADFQISSTNDKTAPDLVLNAFTALGNGVYTWTTTSTTAATFTLTGVVDGVTLKTQPTVKFVSSGVSASTSSFVVTLNDQLADGTSKDTATAYANDQYGNPVANATVSVEDKTEGANAGVLQPSPATCVTDVTGSCVLGWSANDVGSYVAQGTIGSLSPDDGSGALDLRFTVGNISATKSDLVVTPASLTVGGMATATVTIRDGNGILVPGGVASFTLETGLSGTGAPVLSTAACTTDASGACSVSLSSLLAGVVKVHATVSEDGTAAEVGGNGNPVMGSPVTVTFNPGPVCFTQCDPVDPAHVTSIVVTTNGVAANGTAQDVVTAYAYDTKGNPLSGVQVQTSSTDAALNIVTASATTGPDGTATLQYTSTVAGTHDVDVTIASQTPTGSPVSLIFSPGTADPVRSSLVVSPDPGPIQVDESYTITVNAKDATNNPVTGAFVMFQIPNDVSASASACTTDSSGSCSITVTSTVVGSYDIGAQVAAGVISSSPVTVAFTAGPACIAADGCVKDPGVDDAHTTRVELTVNGQHANGSSADVAVAYAFDSHGNPIQGAVVVSTSDSSVVVGTIAPTHADGSTTIQYTSTVAGLHSADVTINDVTLAGSPVSPEFAAEVGDAEESSWSINQTGPLVVGTGTSSTYTATIHVVDIKNNDVMGAVVTVQSVQSGVTFPSGQTCTTNVVGICTVEVSSTVAGTFDFTALLGSDQIEGSQSRAWIPNGVCGVSPTCTPQAGVDDDHKTRVVLTTNSVVADGVQHDVATVYAYDQYGNPVPSAPVQSKNVILTDVLTTQSGVIQTDASGVAAIWYTSTVSGDHPATVTVGGAIPDNGVDETGSVTLNFVPGPVSVANSSVAVDKPSTTVGETVTATATVRDANDNPVAGVVVSFDKTGSAALLGGSSCTTDATGTCTGRVTDVIAEQVQLSATVIDGGVATPIQYSPLAVTFTVGAVDPSASSFAVSPAGPVVADGTAAYTGTFTARDSFGNPLPGLVLTNIVFSVSSGDVKVSPVVDKGDGTYTVTYTSNVVSSAYTTSLTYQASKIGSDLPIPFTTGTVNAGSGFTVSPASQTVGVPVALTLSVQDVLGNPVNGLTADQFVLSSSNVSGAPELSYGGFAPLANGEYKFTATSTEVGTFTFTAEVDGVTLTAKPVAQFVVADVSASTSYFEVTANDQVDDGVSQDKATAYARDQYGNPVSGVLVSAVDHTTGVNAGVLDPQTQSCTTGVLGSCELAWTSNAVGLYVVEGTIGSLSPEDGSGVLDIRFSVGNISAARSELVVSPASLAAGGNATATVTIRDTTGNVVSGGVASFSLDTSLPSAGDGGPSLSALTCVADSSGTCSVTVTSLLAGDVDVHATVPVVGVPIEVGGNGDPVKGSPVTVTFTAGSVCFTGCNPLDTDNTTRVVMTKNGVAADGVAQDIATAYAYDTYGNPVSGVQVQTSSVDADLKIVSAVAITGADGTATLQYTSTQTGAHVADVTIGTQTPAGSPVTVFFGPGTSDPTKSTLAISPEGPIQVDEDYTVIAHVVDATGDAVEGALVTFEPPGDVTASDSTCVTDALGLCSVTVTSTVAGSYDIGAHLTTGVISNSPVTVVFTAGLVCFNDCTPLDPSNRTRVEWVVNGQPADGVSPDVAVVWAFDKYGNPVQGAFVSSSADPDVTVGLISDTGANGSTTIQYTSTVVATHSADVYVAGGIPDGSPLSPAFSHEAGEADNSEWTITPSGPLTVGTGAASTYTATITVRDEINNVVPGAVPTINSVESGVTFPSGQTCTTDAAGQCTVDVYSTVAGTFDFTASLGLDQIGTPKSVVWSPDAVCAVASGCTPQPGVDAEHTTRVVVTTNNAIADGVQYNVATVYAFDQYGDPVPNAIVLADKVNPADTLTHQSGTIVTDSSGVATVWYTSPVAGGHVAQVRVGGQIPDNGVDATGTVTLIFVPGPVSAAHSDLQVDKASATAGETVTATATVRDVNMNVVSGAVVSFAGTGSVSLSGTSCTTNSTGTCTVTVKDSVVETVQVSATVLDGGVATPIQDSPQTVTFGVGAVDAGSGFTVSPSKQTVGVPVTLTLSLQDASGNPVNGLTQDMFVLSSSNGSGLPELEYDAFTPLANGVYTLKTTSTAVETFTFTASVNGVTLSAAPTAEFVAAGVSSAKSYFEVTVNDQLADGSLDRAVGYARDQYGNPVSDAQVSVVDKTTGVNAGVLRPGTATCVTDASGSCELTWYTTAVGLYVGAGTIGSLSPDDGSGILDIRFSVGNISAYNSELVVSPSSLTVGETATATVTIRDTSEILVPGGVAVFSLETALSGLGAPSLSEVTCVTDASGTCSVTVTSLLAGDVKVHATVSQAGVPLDVGGYGNPAKGSPVTVTFTAGSVCFTGCNPLDGTHVTSVDVTKNGVAADGAAQDIATAYAYDTYGNPVSGVQVQTSSVDADLKIVSAVASTGADGTATLQYTSTKAGAHVANVTIGSQTPAGSPVTLFFGSGSEDASKSTLSVSPAGPITVGQSYTITANVNDAYGNPENGAFVAFQVPDDVSASGSTCVTGSLGTCSVTVTSTVAGSYDIGAQLAAGVISNSPVTVEFTAGSVCFTGCTPTDPLNTTRVVLTVNGQPADGVSPDVAVVYAYDQYGNPVSGAVVVSSFAHPDVVVGSIAPTGVNGSTTIQYTSTVAGVHPADVTVDGKTPDGSPVSLAFSAEGGQAEKSSWSVTPSGPLTVGTSAGSTYTASVTIRDESNNAVQGAVPTVTSVQSGVTFPSGRTCTTDASGQCTVDVYSTVAGTFELTASLGSVQIGATESRAWIPDVVCGIAPGCIPQPGVDAAHTTSVAVTTNNVAADGVQRDVATVYAFDQYGNPVPNALVQSTSADGDLVIQSGAIATNASGVATIWYTSTVGGNHNALVTVGGAIPANGVDDIGTVTVTFVDVTAPSAPTIDSPATGDLTNDRPVTVDGTAEPGSTVEVVDQTTGATVCTATANAGGQWSCQVTLSDGDHILAANATDAAGNRSVDSAAVDVTVDTAAPSAPRVDTANGTDVAGGPGSSEPGATITVTWPDGTTDTTTVNPDGSWSIPTPPGTPSGEVSVTATDPAGNTSGETTADLDATAPAAPRVDTANGTDVAGGPGSSEPGSTITVTWPDGSTGTTTVNPDGSWSIPTPPGTPSGEVSVTATDPAGNTSGETTADLDATAPGAPRVDTANGTDVAGGPGSSEPGSTITVTWPDGSTDTTTVNPDGSWSIPTPVGTPDGEISVTATDPAGNTSAATTANLDATAPAAPRVDTADEAVVAGGIGSSEPGATITVTWPDGSTGTTTVNPNGSWSIQTPPGISSGEILVTATDPAGNTSPVTKADLDADAPGAPRVDTANDTEVSGGPGSSEPGSTITVTWPDGTTDTTTVNPDGSWSIPTPADVPDGEITVTATDPDGNTSGETTVDLDTTAPGAPRVDTANGTDVAGGPGSSEPGATITVTWPDGTTGTTTVNPDGSWTIPTPAGTPDGEISVTATDPAGNTSPVTTADLDADAPGAPRVDTADEAVVSGGPGSSEPGSTITVTWPDGSTGTTTVNPDGSWSIPTPPGTVSGEISVTATDSAGNTSPATKADLDTAAPAAPRVDTADEAVVAGGIGSSEPGATITVTWPDGSTGTTTVNPNGSWSIQTPPGISSGEISVTATDPAGNTSPVTKADLDADAPGAPRVDTANGTEVSGGLGSSEPGSTITVTWPDGTTDTTTVNPDGSWSIPTPAGTPDGEISVTATDPDGNTSGVTTVDLDTTAPGAPRVDTANGTDVAGGPGSAEPGATITVTWPDGSTGTTTVNPDGSWSILTPAGTPSGEISVTATDPAGNTSAETKKDLDTSAPGAPRVDTVDEAVVAGGPGSAEPGATITVTWPDGSTGTTTVNPDGSWSIPTPAGTPDGVITVTATDPAGNTSAETKKDLDTSAPSAPRVDTVNGTEVAGGPGSSEPGSTITVTWPDGTTDTTTVNPDGSWSILTPAGVPDGEITVTATDPAGNISPETKTHLDTAAPADVPLAPRVDTANGTEVSGGPGSSEPGATITVTWPDGSTETATVNPDGSWSIPTPAGTGSGEISVTVTNSAGITSGETKKNLDTAAPSAPRVDIADGAEVSGGPGSSEPGATITVTWPDGSTGSTTVKPDGSWSIPTPAGTGSGEITVTATDPAGNTSAETKKDLDTRGPSAPVLNPTDGTVITGKAEPGSTITITDGDGKPVVCREGVVVAGADGSFRCTPVTPLPPHTIIDAVATDKAGNTSAPREAVTTLLEISADFTVRESGESLVVVGTGFIPGETVDLWFCTTCSCVGTAIADADGKVVITFEIPEGTEPGDHILRLTGDQSGPYIGSVEMALEVTIDRDIDLVPPSTPVLNPTDGKVITGKAEPGSTITITDGSGKPIVCKEGVVVAGADGGFRCTPVTPLPPDTIIDAFATDKAGNTSLPREAVVGLLGISADFTLRESGQSQTVVGTGFIPGETVSLWFCTTCSCVGTAIADADGKVVITFEIPEGTLPGSHILRLIGDQSGPYMGSVEMTFVVAAKVKPDTAVKPDTPAKAGTPVKVDSGGYATASGDSVGIPLGASGLAFAILLLGLALKIVVPTLRKDKVGA